MMMTIAGVGGGIHSIYKGRRDWRAFTVLIPRRTWRQQWPRVHTAEWLVIECRRSFAILGLAGCFDKGILGTCIVAAGGSHAASLEREIVDFVASLSRSLL